MIAPLVAACLAGAPLSATAPPATVPAADPDRAGPAPAPLPLASLDETLDVAGRAVAAREAEDRLTVGVRVNGAGPFPFLLDTGADGSVVGLRLAGQLGLRSRGCVRLHGTAGTALVPTVHVDRLRVGDRLVEDVSAPVLPEAALFADGVVGIDALGGQRVRLDFAARTITLEDARRRDSAPAGDPGDVVVTARHRRAQLILAAGSSSGVRMLAVIDTGANVTIGNGALRARLFGRRGALERRLVTLTSVTGQEVVADLAVVPELSIGSLRLRDVPVAFADVPPFALFGLTGTPSVLLGTDVLRAFRRVTLDFRRHKVRFTLRAAEGR